MRTPTPRVTPRVVTLVAAAGATAVGAVLILYSLPNQEMPSDGPYEEYEAASRQMLEELRRELESELRALSSSDPPSIEDKERIKQLLERIGIDERLRQEGRKFMESPQESRRILEMLENEPMKEVKRRTTVR